MRKLKSPTIGEKNGEKYNGKFLSIIKKMVAIALSLGITITVAEAIEIYNKRTRDTNQEAAISQKDKSADKILAEFEEIVKKYSEAKTSNNVNEQRRLNEEVNEAGYAKFISEEIKKSVIELLGENPEELQVVMDGKGCYIADKKNIGYASNGTVVYKKDIEIPSELKKLLKEACAVYDLGNNGVEETNGLYEKYKDLIEVIGARKANAKKEMER